jgi:hypothetical protein
MLMLIRWRLAKSRVPGDMTTCAQPADGPRPGAHCSKGWCSVSLAKMRSMFNAPIKIGAFNLARPQSVPCLSR